MFEGSAICGGEITMMLNDRKLVAQLSTLRYHFDNIQSLTTVPSAIEQEIGVFRNGNRRMLKAEFHNTFADSPDQFRFDSWTSDIDQTHIFNVIDGKV